MSEILPEHKEKLFSKALKVISYTLSLMISHHNFFQNVPRPLLGDRCDLSAPVSWLLFHHDCDDLAEFSWMRCTWFYFCGKEAWMQESADKHWGMLGPLPHLGGDRNLLLYLIYRTIMIKLLEYMFVYLFLHDIHVFLCVLASQRPVLEPPYIQRHHSVCTYSRTRHLTARLPGCRPGVSPIYHYPQALQCDCTYCSSNHTECETF